MTMLSDHIKSKSNVGQAQLFDGEVESDLTVYFDEAREAERKYDLSEMIVSELKHIHANMENLAKDTETCLDNGGMDATAAHFAQSYARSMLEPIGIEMDYIKLDSFEDASGRMTSTTFQLDNFIAKIKELWAKVKEWTLTALARAKDLYTKHLSALGRLSKSVDAYREEMKKVKGSAKFTVPAAKSRYLSVDGKYDQGELLKEVYNLPELVKTGENLSTRGDVLKRLNTVATGLEALVKVIDEDTDKESVLADVKKVINEINVEIPVASGESVEEENYKITTVAKLLGGWEFQFKTPVPREDDDDAPTTIELKKLAATTSLLKDKSEDYDFDNDLEVSMSDGDLAKILEGLSKGLKAVVSSKLDPAKAENASKTLNKSVDNLIKTLEKKSEELKSFPFVRVAVSGFASSTSGIAGSVASSSVVVPRYMGKAGPALFAFAKQAGSEIKKASK